MSAATSAATAAVTAAAAAAAKRKTIEEQESNHHLRFGRDWEFKIVRAVWPSFRRRENLERLLAEEAGAGWRLVEKLDNNRVRLARPVSERSRQLSPSIDPYRSWWGVPQAWIVFWLILAVLAPIFLIGLALAAA